MSPKSPIVNVAKICSRDVKFGDNHSTNDETNTFTASYIGHASLIAKTIEYKKITSERKI